MGAARRSAQREPEPDPDPEPEPGVEPELFPPRVFAPSSEQPATPSDSAVSRAAATASRLD
ncbi:hypothetical protein TH66_16300 [Carbonactinospora thermoautotrophica]|uniref:Uncharacterized protein n=1 Tax=Carbonactinospora thermoautotrophica TaxID=1469144 RepID=A0A132MRB2_9ACTN|nr:hypothetical protein TH66_16300 [Carbonactinospora thermoautotrophica]KWX10440.1 hypothetical protein TR74_03600 [Carbonactinospora thermoautotrophica]